MDKLGLIILAGGFEFSNGATLRHYCLGLMVKASYLMHFVGIRSGCG